MLLSLLIFFAQNPTDAPMATHLAPAAVQETKRQELPLDHVILISIDGLRSDALLVNGGEGLPNYQRLRFGAHTLNARCDPDYSITLPNHVDMLTGRLAKGDGGHGWTGNLPPHPGDQLIDAEGAVLKSLFHQTHAAGVQSTFLASKPKFVLFTQSWNPTTELRVMDQVLIKNDAEAQMEQLFLTLEQTASSRSFIFLHLRGPDDAGHAAGWNLTPGSGYLKAVKETDRQIGRILQFLDQRPELRASTALVLTTDHGGGIPHRNHNGPGMMWVNTIIPFFVNLPQNEPVDLYAMCKNSRKDPGLDPIARDPQELPPIRNADVANLCLALLGLEPIPGSTVNLSQDIVGALFQ